MSAQKRQIVWIDLQGKTTATIPCADPDNSSIMAALQNHSGADVFSWFEGPANFLTPAPSGVEFAGVTDVARLVFTDASGSLVTLALPAPNLGIFEADTSTVDPSTITDIITACVGSLCSAAGGLVTAYVAGTRGIRGQGG